MNDYNLLDEALEIAADMEAQTEAMDAAQWLEQIATMLAASPGYQFVFLVAAPVTDDQTVFRQLSNSSIPGVFWLLNVGARELMRRSQDDPGA